MTEASSAPATALESKDAAQPSASIELVESLQKGFVKVASVDKAFKDCPLLANADTDDDAADSKSAAASAAKLQIPANNFLKSAKFSPDGLCILTNSEDNILRLFELTSTGASGSSSSSNASHNLSLALAVNGGESRYDCAWFPTMRSDKPETCCFATTARDQPVVLHDAFTGKGRAAYRCYDSADELASAVSVAFSPDGSRLYCGFEKKICVFDVARPGRDYDQWITLVTARYHGKRKRHEGQGGLLASLVVSPDAS